MRHRTSTSVRSRAARELAEQVSRSNDSPRINVGAGRNLDAFAQPANMRPVKGRVRPGVVLDGTYHIVRLVGEGGMGEVYEARHARLAGRYAVKVMHPEIRKHPKPRSPRRCGIRASCR
jgi:serine/threonine protein kinase